jgi:hypothetical protein
LAVLAIGFAQGLYALNVADGEKENVTAIINVLVQALLQCVSTPSSLTRIDRSFVIGHPTMTSSQSGMALPDRFYYLPVDMSHDSPAGLILFYLQAVYCIERLLTDPIHTVGMS